MLSQCKQKISTRPPAENRVLERKPTPSKPVTSGGEVAPRHVFYRLTMGNLQEANFSEI
jgi:hypothetical protein